MTELEITKAALSEAEAQVRARKAARDAEVNAVKDRWAPVVSEAETAAGLAAHAYRQAQYAATPDHPWTGKRVFWIETIYSRFSGRATSTKRYDGIVETYRHGVDTGPGYMYITPGQGFVRLLLASGKTGKRSAQLGDRWQLVDEVTAGGDA